MTPDEINLSAVLAEKTLASLGLTPAAVRKPESIFFMTAGRMDSIKTNPIKHQATPRNPHEVQHIADCQKLLARLKNLKNYGHGALIKVWKGAGFKNNPVHHMMSGRQATVSPDKVIRITASLDALYPEGT